MEEIQESQTGRTLSAQEGALQRPGHLSQSPQGQGTSLRSENAFYCLQLAVSHGLPAAMVTIGSAGKDVNRVSDHVDCLYPGKVVKHLPLSCLLCVCGKWIVNILTDLQIHHDFILFIKQIGPGCVHRAFISTFLFLWPTAGFSYTVSFPSQKCRVVETPLRCPTNTRILPAGNGRKLSWGPRGTTGDHWGPLHPLKM